MSTFYVEQMTFRAADLGGLSLIMRMCALQKPQTRGLLSKLKVAENFINILTGSQLCKLNLNRIFIASVSDWRKRSRTLTIRK